MTHEATPEATPGAVPAGRLRRRAAAGIAGLLAAVLAAGCTSDAEDGAPEEEPSASAPATPTEASPAPTATSPTAPASPSVSAATGVELRFPNVSLRAPEGWQAKEAPLDLARRAMAPGAAHQVVLTSTEAIGETDLAELTQAALETQGLSRTALRDPVELAGVEFYHLVSANEVSHYEYFGTVHDGHLISIDFTLGGSRPAAERRQVVASTIASLSWR